jgi:glycogen debranching enzyme
MPSVGEGKNMNAWLDAVGADHSSRDRTLLLRAAKTLEGNILIPAGGEVFPWSPYRGISPSAGHYNGVWDWDSAFHACTVARWDPDLAREQLKILLRFQDTSGRFPDAIYTDGTHEMFLGKPPVWPWACMRIDQMQPDDGFLAQVYPRFKRCEAYWVLYCKGGGPRHDKQDHDPEPLFHYDAPARDEHKRCHDAKVGSGWDTSVRWDVGSYQLWTIDLNCYMVLVYRALAYMARRLNNETEASQWQAKESTLAESINQIMWNEKTGCYYDVFRLGWSRHTYIMTPASFMPLFIGIASAQQAERMAAIAQSRDKFYPGMPTVAYDHPEYISHSYWRGPTWLNVAWFACKGLKRYGCGDLADQIRQTILDWCARNEDSIYEYYDSRFGKGLGARNFGWSAAFIIEFILGWDD